MSRLALIAALGLAALSPAVAADYAGPAETLRSRLADAQIEVTFDRAQAAGLVREAGLAAAELRPALAAVNPKAAGDVEAALNDAVRAAKAGDEAGLAAARARAWTALLGGTYTGLEASIRSGDAASARDWLAAREFRTASAFTRLSADATGAVEALGAGKLTPQATLEAVRADVLDGYQARLGGALRDLETAQARGWRTRSAEQAALARGYFALLAPAYREQRGAERLARLEADLAALPASLPRVQADLGGFRAAPLSAVELRARAGQVTRFLALVPVEYGRGVKLSGGSPVVTSDLEVTEARTFLTGARAAFTDLAPLLPRGADAAGLRAGFAGLEAGLNRAAAHDGAPAPSSIEADVNALLGQVRTAFPAAWQAHDASADLGVIRTQLDAVVSAAEGGDWAAAETARLDAYATLESGAEARIAVFAPDLKLRLENLFWNGQRPDGLARLIRERGTPAAFRETRAALEDGLRETARMLGTEVAPAAVATNAGVIVFREGLEAVLILAALMGSLRRPEVKHLRRPMWLGAAGAFLATAVTWFVLSGTLGLFARYGEKLEAVVSVIAIAVLLLIMNWFFHQVYWTDRMAAFQKHKHGLTVGGVAQTGQWIGLAVLGFTSIYREGFETVLFLQSLVLQSGAAPVLTGTGLGLVSVIGVGVLVFALQARLPMKKLLVWTGMMICAVLAVMVGNTVHVLQLVGWFPVHPLGFEFPSWASLWLGVYPTWEGIIAQVVAAVAVVGSYFAAEAVKTRQLEAKRREASQAAGAGAGAASTQP
ncbi:iron permease [Deinococcus aetherius]|uniref:Iron permease n=1 Tax=Deinococcus aetherius TaxID=200252 RepID=A0ABM8ADP2_9DEIO|nr:FTR1 family protein [Deinococcus aetherius]BDP41894.1 iron permease [Deinococcus aetherius]